MVNFIEGKVLRRPGLHITEDTPLVSSGLIDSLALITLLLELETITNRRIPPGKIQAKDMDTVRLMFATAERVGKPRS
ncbi:MAG: phosphopantetheine-binding protein [Nitrososphaera sp.]|nr:phosphopantetheine-binding protein [Nitrososphaera sp.]